MGSVKSLGYTAVFKVAYILRPGSEAALDFFAAERPGRSHSSAPTCPVTVEILCGEDEIHYCMEMALESADVFKFGFERIEPTKRAFNVIIGDSV